MTPPVVVLRIIAHDELMSMAQYLLFSLVILFSGGRVAAASPEARGAIWALPMQISDRNTKISYSYSMLGSDHSGTARGVSGEIWLAGTDPQSVRGQIVIPVPEIPLLPEGSLGSWDELLPKAALSPVRVQIDKLTSNCNPRTMADSTRCSGVIDGRMSFQSMEHEISIPITIERHAETFAIKGSGNFDPSNEPDEASLPVPIDQAHGSFLIELRRISS